MKTKDTSKVRGFFKLNIVNPDGTVANRGPWHENQIVNTGYQDMLMYLLAGSAGSLRPSHAALGTGTVPASSATTLAGELTETAGRMALTTGTSGSKTVQYTFTLNSGVIAAASTIQNVGLFSGSTQAGGTMFAGNTYATSALATNQAVNGTYSVAFA
jgi:hypothetical protein